MSMEWLVPDNRLKNKNAGIRMNEHWHSFGWYVQVLCFNNAINRTNRYTLG